MDKEILSLENGKIIVIRPKDMSTIVPLFCRCCSFPMKTMDDSISYRKHQVCSKCDDRWTNDKKVDWKTALLPDKSSEDWIEYIELRAFYAKTIITYR